MVEAKCPKCNSTTFEMAPAKINNTNFEHKFVLCSDCGVIISALETESIAKGITHLENRLKNMEANLSQQLLKLKSQI